MCPALREICFLGFCVAENVLDDEQHVTSATSSNKIRNIACLALFLLGV